MNQVQVITDGTAYLPAERLRELGVISLPVVAKLGGRTFMYDQQTDEHAELLQELQAHRQSVEIVGPSPDDFRAAFERTLYRTNKMLVILSSSHLSPIMQNAQIAARDFMGRCDITLLDSQTVSMGLGLLVERAGLLLQEGHLPLPVIIRQVRGMIPHIYVVMITHTLDYLYRSKKISAMQAILGSMLKIHPYLVIEDGRIDPLEKSRAPEKAVDKLIEFASEFTHVEDLVIFHTYNKGTCEETKSLISRLEQILPDCEYPTIAYDPILALHLGPDGLGLVIYEGESWH